MVEPTGGDDDERAGRIAPVENGPFAGWFTWRNNNEGFGGRNGPFYFRLDPDGRVRCAFQVAEKHLNPGKAVHGGCLMTFADIALFAMSQPKRGGDPAVTVSMTSEFVGPAFEGEIVEATGDVLRSGGTLIFVKGLAAVGERPVLNFSGVLKRVKRRDLK